MAATSALRRPTTAVVLAALVVVLVALAATGGRVPLATDAGLGAPSSGRRAPAIEAAETGAAELPSDRAPASDLPGAGVIAVLVQLVIAVLVVAALVAASRTLADRARSRRDEPPEPPPEEHWPAPAVDLVSALDGGLAALRAGTPDDAIVACWVRLEDAAAAAGAGRQPTDTPAEVATRVLGDLHAPPAAIERLLDRYRLARFSRHRLDETDRMVAIHSLEEIRTAIAGVQR